MERERRFWLSGPPPGFDPAAPFQRIVDLYIPGTRLRLGRMTSPAGDTLARNTNGSAWPR